MSRHSSDDELAGYAAGELKPRKAAHVASHLTGCAQCEVRLNELENVPSVLRSVQFPPMPDHLVSRISMAIAAESAARVASQPTSEAGRRELPVRSSSARRGSWLPRLSSPLALRVLATAGAAAVIAGGGYELATHLTSSTGNNTSSSGAEHAAGIPVNVGGGQALRNGPRVSYMHAGRKDSIGAITTATNYKPGTLGAQAAQEIATLKQQRDIGPAANPTASPEFGSTSALPANTGLPSAARLQGCVRRIAAGRLVLLVDLATYLTDPATIIAVQGKSPGTGEVFAVGTSCSAGAADILAHQPLPKA
jgi:hypothetical protein